MNLDTFTLIVCGCASLATGGCNESPLSAPAPRRTNDGGEPRATVIMSLYVPSARACVATGRSRARDDKRVPREKVTNSF